MGSRIIYWRFLLVYTILEPTITIWKIQKLQNSALQVRLKYDGTHSDQKFSESEFYPLIA